MGFALWNTNCQCLKHHNHGFLREKQGAGVNRGMFLCLAEGNMEDADYCAWEIY